MITWFRPSDDIEHSEASSGLLPVTMEDLVLSLAFVCAVGLFFIGVA